MTPEPEPDEADGGDRPGPRNGRNHANSEEILDALPDTTVVDLPLLLLTAISTLVALVGLFANNVAIIVGAMVVSPLLSPINGFTLELAVGRPRRAFANLRALAILLVLIVALSAGITAVLFALGPVTMTPQILDRFERREIYLVMAVLLGIAGVVAQVRGFHESLVGIGISLALLPPAAVAGIALALFRVNALSALALAVDNIIGVMIGGFIGIFYFHLGPSEWGRQALARRDLLRVFGILIVLLALIWASFLLTG